MRKSPTSQTEKAFVAYLQGNSADTVLAPVSVYAGGLAGQANANVPDPSTLSPASPSAPVKTPPYLIFTASSPEQIGGFDSGKYELKLTACLATLIFDETVTDTDDVHRARIEALRDLLEPLALNPSPLNPPVSGPDTRAVQNFSLSGIVYEGEDTRYTDNKIDTEISYYILMCPADS